ncbi:MAG: glycosyltransferase family 39 protein [Chitinispirillaceae bacterium]
MFNKIKKHTWFLSLAVPFLAVVFYLLYKSNVPTTSFDIDEADYMYSFEKGFAAHYFDKNAVPFMSFVKIGLLAGMKSDKQTELSRMIRSADDITFYRHFHGPLFFYYMIFGERFVGKNERAIRTVSLLLQFICSIVVLIGCLFLPGIRYGRSVSLLTSLLVLLSPTLFFTVSLISPHGMFVVWCMVSLFIMMRAVDTRNQRLFYVSVASIAVTFLTTVHAVLLLLCWVICVIAVYRKNKNAFRDIRRLIVISFIIFGGIITVLWPAAFLKMSLIKSDMWVGYIGFIRVHMLASQPLWAFWWNRIAASPVEYGIIAFGVTITAYCLIGKKKISLLPVFSYLVLIMLMEARHVATVPTYVSSLAAVGIVASGIALPVVFEKRAWVPVGILSLMCIGLFVHLRFYYLPQQKLPAETIRTEITAFLKK